MDCIEKTKSEVLWTSEHLDRAGIEKVDCARHQVDQQDETFADEIEKVATVLNTADKDIVHEP